MKIQEFLDTKHGKFIGRVYMLAVLFLFNTAIALGAALFYNFGKSPALLTVGVIGTIISISILSTPTKIDE